MNREPAAFTLIELLVVVAIIAVLVALLFAVGPAALKRGQEATSINNMRQVGAGFQLFAGDNDNRLPSRVKTGERWPKLLGEYLKDAKVYADPGDPENYLRRKTDPLSSTQNNTSYMMNGYNDLGAFNDESVTVYTTNLDAPSQTILLAPAIGHSNFYMDFEEGNQNTVINKRAFGGGSNYLFADGSVRFLKAEDCRDELWLVHK
ncbi:MAG: H-X9-DG-CTERM domain-containing protein, partial [Chthoniobacterales bacterium]